MKIIIYVVVLFCVKLSLARKNNKECQRCIPVQDCQQPRMMPDRRTWLNEFRCEGPEDDAPLFGYTPGAKEDYVCCPNETKSNTNGFPRSQGSKTQRQDKWENNVPNQSMSFDRVGASDMTLGENSSKIPANPNPYQTRTGNDNTLSRNVSSNDQGNNYKESKNRKSFRDPKTKSTEDFDESGSQEFRSSEDLNPQRHRRPQHYHRRQRPTNGFLHNTNSHNAYAQNPYFFPQNQQPSSGMPSPNDNKNLGQCSGITNFPPSPSTGCCGKDPSDSDRIIGGSVTEIDQFPWTVLLKSTFNYGTREAQFNCGGSLISARYVLTAAHCVHEDGATVTDVEVTLAEYDKRTFPQDCTNSYEGRRCVQNIVVHADDIIPHQNFDESRLENDIALVRLRDRAPYSDFIRPICLTPVDIDSPELDNIPLSVAGWGRNGNFESNIKQSTIIHLVPQSECRRYYSQLTRRHLCAAGVTGEDTCKGDSGGPLMILYEGKYFVTGVVSGKRSDAPCGSSVPSLYTNVYHYLDWIRNSIRE